MPLPWHRCPCPHTNALGCYSPRPDRPTDTPACSMNKPRQNHVEKENESRPLGSEALHWHLPSWQRGISSSPDSRGQTTALHHPQGGRQCGRRQGHKRYRPAELTSDAEKSDSESEDVRLGWPQPLHCVYMFPSMCVQKWLRKIDV